MAFSQADDYIALTNSLCDNIEQVLKKCAEHPALKTDNVATVSRIRSRARNIRREIFTEINSLGHRASSKAEEALSRLNEARARGSSTAEHRERLRKALTSLKGAIGAQADSQGSPFLPTDRQRELEALQRQEDELESTLRGLELTEIPALEAALDVAQHEHGLAKREDWQNWSYKRREFEDQLKDLYDQAISLLSWFDSSHQLQQAIKIDFQAKTEEFAKAEEFHRKEARNMFFAMGVVAVATFTAIYVFFISSDALGIHPAPSPPVTVALRGPEPAATATSTVGSSTNTAQATGPLPSNTEPRLAQKGSGSPDNNAPVGAVTPSTLLIIEQVILLATGRLATLLLAAWAFKYVANLHRAHAEQSVIYRDRVAALGVAQNMLLAADTREHKKEVLELLAAGYLNFEQSAFRAKRVANDDSSAGPDAVLDRQIKHVKDAVEAVRPLFDAVGKVTDKVVDKAK